MRLLTILTIAAGLALAADHSGTYVGSIDVSGKKVENKLVLKANGDKLTGTLTNQFGVLTIQDGHVNEDDFFFTVTVKEEGEDFRMVYRGHIFADEIQFRVEAGERQLDLILKKAS